MLDQRNDDPTCKPDEVPLGTGSEQLKSISLPTNKACRSNLQGNEYIKSIRNIMSVNKSYEDKAHKSLEHYKNLRVMYDEALKDMGLASDNALSLKTEKSELEQEIKQLKKYTNDLKNSFAKERKLHKSESNHSEVTLLQLKNTLVQLKTSHKNATDSIKSSNEVVSNLESELHQCNSKLKQYETSYSNLKSILEFERGTFKTGKEESDTRIWNLKKSLENQDKIRTQLLADFTTLKDDSRENENVIASLKQELRAAKAEKSELIQNQDKIRTQLLAEFTTLKDDSRENENVIASLKQELRAAKAEKSELIQEKQELKMKNDSLTKALRTSETARENLIEVETKLMDEMQEIKSKHDEQKINSQKLTISNQDLENKVETLNRKRGLMSQALITKENEVKNLKSDIKNIQVALGRGTAITYEDIGILTEDASELGKTAVTKQNEIVSFKTSTHNLQDEICRKESEITTTHNANETLTKQIVSQKKHHQELILELTALKDKNGELETKSNVLEQELESRGEEVREANLQIDSLSLTVKVSLEEKRASKEKITDLRNSLEQEKALRERLSNDLDNIQEAVEEEIKNHAVEIQKLRRMLDEAASENDALTKRLITDVIKYENAIRDAENKTR